MEKFGKLSVLVNNSAMQEFVDDLKNIDLAVVEKTFRTNILSIFAMTKFALPHMKRGSSIINSCSVAGYMGMFISLGFLESTHTDISKATLTRSSSSSILLREGPEEN